MPAPPPVSRCDKKSKVAAFALTALATLASALNAAELVIESTVGRPGGVVEINVVLNPQGDAVAAIVFEVEFDATRLQFDAEASSEIEIAPIAAAVAGDTLTLETGSGRVGVVVYDSLAPVLSLSAGVIATLHFRVRDGASGFAPVAIGGERRPDASDPDASSVPVSIASAPSGVSIAGTRARGARLR